MKILLSAYACEPGQGTELDVGWHTARELARHHEVWVLTRPDDGRESIETELEKSPVPSLHFVYFTLPVIGSLWKLGHGAFLIHYYLWQIQAYFVARRLHQQIQFDVVQHVTFVKYSIPSFLCLLPIPFIWGPVGGGEFTPKPFYQSLKGRSHLFEKLRKLACWIGEQDPFVRLTARRSALALATTEDTAQRLSLLGAKIVHVSSQLGLPPTEIHQLAAYPILKTSPLRFLSIGRLLHWKGFDLGLQAFAQAALPHAEYWIVGDGPERRSLQRLAETLGIASQVRFLETLPRQETLQTLASCHVLVHPSLHDSGALVCLEAMAAGRPVVCLNLGGPAVQVTPETGFKIAAHTPNQAIADLATALTQLAGHPDLRVQMGQAARQRVQSTYNWQTKGAILAQICTRVATQNTLSLDLHYRQEMTHADPNGS
jgi:glycosyltransferase involved in cell wall biosynthesis